ncbi:MAG: right-handed parallel beta-helix repeat-containing protein [Solirubrobacterales bacterium]
MSGAEAASNVSCGDTLTTDTTLHKDLVDCPNNGIVIGADHVTLNLNGHRVDGNGALVHNCPSGEDCDVGIDNPGHDGVTVKGGAVRQFGFGVLAYQTRHLQLQRLAVSHNQFSGIVIAASTRAVLKKLVTTADGLTTDQSGMAFFDTDHLRLEDSKLRANGDIGLYDENLNRSRLTGNRFGLNPEAGALVNGDGNLVAHNRFRRDGVGVGLGGNDNIVRRNVADSTGLGLQVGEGKRNLFARNRVRNARGVGIDVASYGPVADTVIRRNRIRGAGKDGLDVSSVRKTLKRTQVRRNRVFHSGDDGIDAASASTTLTGNEADRNADLGIAALRGVTDGGANIARHNGDPRQCTHIACN